MGKVRTISIEADAPYAIVLIEDKHKFYSSSSAGKQSGKPQRGFDWVAPLGLPLPLVV